MLESIEGGEQISRYSFIGADPYKIIRSGENEELNGDPLVHIQKEMDNIKYFLFKDFHNLLVELLVTFHTTVFNISNQELHVN